MWQLSFKVFKFSPSLEEVDCVTKSVTNVTKSVTLAKEAWPDPEKIRMKPRPEVGQKKSVRRHLVLVAAAGKVKLSTVDTSRHSS